MSWCAWSCAPAASSDARTSSRTPGTGTRAHPCASPEENFYEIILLSIFRFIQIDKSTGSPYHVRGEVVAVGEVSVAEVAGVHHLPVGRAGHPPDGQAVGKVLLLVRFQT